MVRVRVAPSPRQVRYVTEGGTGDFGLFQDDDEAKTPYIIYKRSGA